MGNNSKAESPANPDKPAKSTDTGRRKFLKYAAVGAVGVGIASAVEIPALTNMLNGEETKLQEANNKVNQLNSQLQQSQSQLQSDQSQISSLNSQVSSLQAQQAGSNGIIDLSINEQKELEAIVEAIIPSDSSGPGAKEAGVLYFIARQLGTDYGTNARMYMRGPFVQPGISGPLTVDNITYAAGSQDVPWQAGMKYQYNMTLRDFWRYGLEALQNYTNYILGKNFEALSSSDQVQVLNDLYDNKPADFNGIVPKDFFQELIFMTWSGFTMDPMYGGNMGLVGWKLTGFTGANMSNAFGDGQDPTKLMVADKPTRFSPHSLGEYQQTLKITGGS